MSYSGILISSKLLYRDILPANTHSIQSSSNISMESCRSDNAPRHIPSVLLEEIFLNLPVRSLLRLKSVSKFWHSLITSPQFAKAHLKSNKDHDNLRVLSVNKFQLVDYSLTAVLDGLRPDPSRVDHKMITRDSHNGFYAVASCDGLVCIRSRNDFRIWNPCTGKSKILPDLGPMNSAVNCGLSYDYSCDDYKLVVISDKVGDFCGEVNVCSIKTGSWKTIGDFKGRPQPDDSQFIINGKHHWQVVYSPDIDGDYPSRGNIVSLDIATEKYCAIELPHIERRNLHMRLLPFGQFLSLHCYSSYITWYELQVSYLWVMREYGVKESWTKVMTYPFGYTFPNLEPAFKPIYISGIEDNDTCISIQAIMSNGDFLFSHNRKKGISYLKYCCGGYRTQIYAPSLISPA